MICTKSWQNIALAMILVIAGQLAYSSASAQEGTDGLKTNYDRFWIDYTVIMKKIKSEKNDQHAAQQTDQMKKDIIPRFTRLLQETAAWKKDHGKAEAQQLEHWVNSNPHAVEASDLQSALMIRAASERGAFGKSFMEYLHALAVSAKTK